MPMPPPDDTGDQMPMVTSEDERSCLDERLGSLPSYGVQYVVTVLESDMMTALPGLLR